MKTRAVPFTKKSGSYNFGFSILVGTSLVHRGGNPSVVTGQAPVESLRSASGEVYRNQAFSAQNSAFHKPLGFDTSLCSYSTGALAQRLTGKGFTPTCTSEELACAIVPKLVKEAFSAAHSRQRS